MAHLRKGSLRPGRMLFLSFMLYITALLLRWWPDIRRLHAMALRQACQTKPFILLP